MLRNAADWLQRRDRAPLQPIQSGNGSLFYKTHASLGGVDGILHQRSGDESGDAQLELE